MNAPAIGKHLATLNLFREADGSVQITVADARGFIDTWQGEPMKAAPIHYVEAAIVQAARNIAARRPDLTDDNAYRDTLLEFAASVCEDITSWGLPPTKSEVAQSTQKFCAKAIRAQRSDSPERAKQETKDTV